MVSFGPQRSLDRRTFVWKRVLVLTAKRHIAEFDIACIFSFGLKYSAFYYISVTVELTKNAFTFRSCIYIGIAPLLIGSILW